MNEITIDKLRQTTKLFVSLKKTKKTAMEIYIQKSYR